MFISDLSYFLPCCQFLFKLLAFSQCLLHFKHFLGLYIINMAFTYGNNTCLHPSASSPASQVSLTLVVKFLACIVPEMNNDVNVCYPRFLLIAVCVLCRAAQTLVALRAVSEPYLSRVCIIWKQFKYNLQHKLSTNIHKIILTVGMFYCYNKTQLISIAR